jgi:hypothetical protein
MSVEVISSGQVTAKKRHRCTWCGEWIEAGERYTKEFVKVDGDPSSNKLHPECDADLAECARNEGGSCTYTLYGQERPKQFSEEVRVSD